MKKGIVDVELMNRPMTRCSELKDNTNRDGFHNRRKGLREINAGTLCEAMNNPTGLVPVQRAIRKELMPKYPLASNDVSSRGTRNQRPSPVGARASYSERMAASQCGSLNAERTERGTEEMTVTLRL